jgi:hypothetical protein
MKRLADRLPQGTRIILIGNAPTAWAGGPQMLDGWLRCRAYRNADCPTSYRPENAYRGEAKHNIVIDPVLRALAAQDPRFAYVDARAPLCPQGRCLVIQDGRLNHWDSNHLTRRAAARIIGTIDPGLFAR